MGVLRFVVAFGLASGVTFGLFYLMQAMIIVEGELNDDGKIKVVDFVRVKRTEEVKKKDREPPKKSQIDDEPPPPDFSMDQTSSLDSGGIGIAAAVDTSMGLDTGGGFSMASADGDAVPMVRVPPQYPERAMQRGIEGRVLVEFTISKSGSVKDEKVIAATLGQTPGAFWAQAIGGGIGVLVFLLALSSVLGGVFAAALGGAVGTLVGLLVVDMRAKRGADHDPENGEALLAAQVPTGRTMVAITDQRMLFFYMTPFANSPKQLLLEIDVDDAPTVGVPDGDKFVGSMTFTFSDQSVATTEVLKAGKPQLFADAVAVVSGPASE